ncbi:otoferlin-like [Colletes gigas]|uniref:otoferlin-like n=1 Tax=Colletes gigas TaxID=935657 RepID=UPI001C9B96EA|nr:otoferlin-like [Colletes gigas]
MSPRSLRPSPYQICITILEARHLPQNVNPLVVVRVGNRKRKTVVRERTDAPVYNEYFVFDLVCNLDELLGTKIMIAVYLKSSLRLKFYGSTSFEVALVWEQPDRQYYHKWAMLTNPKDLAAGPRGYVKCNIAINVKGEKLKVYPETEGEDDIEGNLLLPVGGEYLPFRQHARYVFAIYRADGLPDMSSVCTKSDFENINPYVQISFAGMKERLWTTEEYYLVAVLYDVSLIDRRKFLTKSISFEVSIGNAGNRQFPHSQCFEDINDENRMLERRPEFESGTASRLTGSLDGKYNYLPLGSRKPCLYVKSWWPNLEWRMHNSNSLAFMADFLEQKLEKLDGLVALEDPEAYKLYNETILELKGRCIRYLHTLDTGEYDDKGGTTKLDRHRVHLCRSIIEDILKRIKINGELPNNRYLKIAMVHAYQYLCKVKKLREDPQHGLPDVFVWMMAGSKRVACTRLSAEEIIYSEEETERGRTCGQKVDVFLRHPRDDNEADYAACKLELFLWLGNAEYVGACWSSIPSGYQVDHEKTVDSFPKYIEYTRSTVIKQTLDPFWDQTLILPPRTIHGTKEYTKLHPPNVTLQVFDQDICGTKEFCGRCTAIPLVKLAAETYSPPDFPPKLEWYKFKSQRDCSGSVLAAFELIEVEDDEEVDRPMSASKQDIVYNIPVDIRPKMACYKLEVIFWGVRDMKKMNYLPVLKPRIIIECAGVDVKSEVMENAKKFSNFEEPHIIVELDMPELSIYYPSVTIKTYDSRGFGCFKYVGICIIPSVYVFLEQLITEEDYDTQIHETKSILKSPWTKKRSATILSLPIDYDPSKDENRELIPYKKMAGKDLSSRIWRVLRSVKKLFALFLGRKRRKKKSTRLEEDGDESLDWWSKYFASLEEERSKLLKSQAPEGRKLVATFKVYDGELELQPEFAGFQDRLRSFELWRGRKAENPDYDSDNYVGKFKGRICVYRWPHPANLPCKTRTGRNAVNGLCDDYPSSESVRLFVRLYVVKGINLQPNDPLSGKSDPYLYVRLGKTYINDRKNFIPNQLNPTFGRLFEIEATFPKDHTMIVQVWDYDAATSDDLIGETKIDLENRFYSGHRATCGISKSYNADGYNYWRDREKPTMILDNLCKMNNLPSPEYGEDGVKIGRKNFRFLDVLAKDEPDREECMALNVLHQWQDFPICGCALVPEHIERRPLFNAAKPGLEQGKLELWIDMFQCGELPPKPAVDIRPMVPEEYEIRVIVWNTENVPLVESQFLTGEKCSDIYVKGWILYDDYQKTDVHYNSLNGEGNFNWRFIFRVTYSKGERVMIVRRKVSVLDRSETEDKLPCKLHLQVWDSDHFSPDDFLGALTLDLSRMPRGSGNSKNCTLKILDPSLPTTDLFKVMRIKAWWPFRQSVGTADYVQAGKVELEMSIMSVEEADEQPAGKGRDPPQELPPPKYEGT